MLRKKVTHPSHETGLVNPAVKALKEPPLKNESLLKAAERVSNPAGQNKDFCPTGKDKSKTPRKKAAAIRNAQEPQEREASFQSSKNPEKACYSRIDTAALTPAQIAWRLLDVLYKKMPLQNKPDFVLETIFSEGFGPSFVPVGLKIDSFDSQQAQRARFVLTPLLAPLSPSQLAEGYRRLKLGCSGPNLSLEEEKTRMSLYLDMLGRYPACVVCSVLAHPFKWFPSLGDLTQLCQEENRYLGLLRDTFF